MNVINEKINSKIPNTKLLRKSDSLYEKANSNLYSMNLINENINSTKVGGNISENG